MLSITEKQVYQALQQVIDPELNIDIVSLGLIYQVQITDEMINLNSTRNRNT